MGDELKTDSLETTIERQRKQSDHSLRDKRVEEAYRHAGKTPGPQNSLADVSASVLKQTPSGGPASDPCGDKKKEDTMTPKNRKTSGHLKKAEVFLKKHRTVRCFLQKRGGKRI